MHKGKLITAALAIAIGAAMAACDVQVTDPSRRQVVTTEHVGSLVLTTTHLKGGQAVTRIRDSETGVVCYKFGAEIYSSHSLSCAQDINAIASVPEDVTTTTLTQDQIEWVFNGKNN